MSVQNLLPSSSARPTLLDPLPLGIFLGLVLGKLIGVSGVAFITIKSGITSLPAGSNWGQVAGVSVLCGIGFTMSLFIGGLAFAESGLGYNRMDRLSIVCASRASLDR